MSTQTKRIFLAILIAAIAAVTLCATLFSMRKSMRRKLMLGDAGNTPPAYCHAPAVPYTLILRKDAGLPCFTKS